MSHYDEQRPATALHLADAFILVDRESYALEALYKALEFNHEKEWTPNHEKVVLKYLDLCIKSRNNLLANDALYQYCNLTQQVAVHSLKKVVDHFLDLTEQRTKEASEIDDNVKDLFAVNSPEKLLLALDTGNFCQNRHGQYEFIQWFNFLWEFYQNCLEMLRNNFHVEEIYHDVVRKAFIFCANYNRHSEFNKLCDILRVHLDELQKLQGLGACYYQVTYRIDLKNPKSLILIRKTCEIQFDTAIQMEQWQESYKSAVVLHSMMEKLDNSEIEPSSMLKYFDNLAKILWKGGNNLFHAIALLQKFKVYKIMDLCTDEETSEQATQLILATLSILQNSPIPASVLAKQLDLEDQHWENIHELSNLLCLDNVPTRADLLAELESLGILDLTSEPIRKIYKVLELDFSPLHLASEIKVELDNLEKHSQYIEDLKLVAATRILNQLATVYDSLSFDGIEKIISFYNRFEFEHFLAQSIKQGLLNARMDHCDNRVYFNELDFTLAGNTQVDFEISKRLTEIEYTRLHFDLLHSQLRDFVVDLECGKLKQASPNELQKTAQEYLRNKDAAHKFFLEYSNALEKEKDARETERQAKIKQQQEEKAKREKQRIAEQNELQSAERRNREIKRLKAKNDAIEEKKKVEKLRSLQKEPDFKKLIKLHGEEAIKDMDLEEIKKKLIELVKIEDREEQEKLRKQEENFNYMIRARFLEESKYYNQMSEDFHSIAEERYSNSEKNRVERETKEREFSVKEYEDLNVVVEQAVDFLKIRVELHSEDLDKLKLKWKKKCAREKVKRLADREITRKIDREKAAKKAAREAKEAEKARIEFEEREAANLARKAHYEMLQRIRDRENASRGYVPSSKRQIKPVRGTNANAIPVGATITRDRPAVRAPPKSDVYVSQALRQEMPVQYAKPATPVKDYGVQHLSKLTDLKPKFVPPSQRQTERIQIEKTIPATFNSGDSKPEFVPRHLRQK